MKIRAALAAADAGEGGDGIPIAVAVAAKNEVRVTLAVHLAKFPCHFLLDKLIMSWLYVLIRFIEIYKKDKFFQLTFYLTLNESIFNSVIFQLFLSYNLIIIEF